MKRIFRIAMISGLVLVAASCGSKKKDAKNEQQAEVQPLVYVQTATKQEVTQEESYSSTVEAYAVNNIAPQSSSRIKRVRVDVGSFVGKGQVLAEMDVAQLEQTRLKMVNDSTEFSRIKDLYAEGGISRSDYEALELSYKVSRSSFDNLLENTVLRAPISGVITERNYDSGDMYTMGQPIFVLQQISPVKLLVGVSEADYTKIKVGDQVTITVDALPGQTFSGNVFKVYPVMDATTHTFTVEIRVANNDRVLRPGMYARVTIVYGKNNSVVVPDNAIVKMQGAGQRSVYVVNDNNEAVEKIVTIGRHFDDKYEILSGVEEGDRVVVRGQSSLRNGVKVQIGEE